MITDDDNRWHYLAVKNLPALFRGITSTSNRNFYCLNCFHSYHTLNKLKKHERVSNKENMERTWKNKRLTWRKVIKSSYYNICRFRMSIKKNALLSK